MSAEPMAEMLARQIYVRLPACGASVKELANIAMLAAVEAAGRFKPERGSAFSDFARKRMRGAIFDYLRKEDHVSRDRRKLLKTVEELSVKLGPGVAPSAVRAAAGIDPAREYRLGEVTLAPMRSDTRGPDALDILAQIPDKTKLADTKVMRAEVLKILGWTLSHFSRRTRRLMELYYFGELTCDQIAEELNISQSRVSQIHCETLAQCREIFARRGVKDYQQLAA